MLLSPTSNIYIILYNMNKHTQSSRYGINALRAFELIGKVPPSMAVSENRATLYYFASQGSLDKGFMLKYRLIYGFLRIEWTSQIIRSDHSKMIVTSGCSEGLFTHFSAIHLFEEESGACLIQDTLEFQTENPRLAEVMKNIEVRFGFSQRSGEFREDETTRFKVIRQESA
jgi:hypothetical protein